MTVFKIQIVIPSLNKKILGVDHFISMLLFWHSPILTAGISNRHYTHCWNLLILFTSFFAIMANSSQSKHLSSKFFSYWFMLHTGRKGKSSQSYPKNHAYFVDAFDPASDNKRKSKRQKATESRNEALAGKWRWMWKLLLIYSCYRISF